MGFKVSIYTGIKSGQAGVVLGVWYHLSLRFKILAGFSSLMMLMILSIGITLYQVSTVEKSAKAVIEKQQPAAFALLLISDGINRITTNLNGYLLTAEPEQKKEYKVLRESLWVELKNLRSKVEAGEIDIESTKLDEIERLYQDFSADGDRLFELRDDSYKNYPGLQAASDLLNPLNLEYTGLLNQIIIYEVDKPASQQQQIVLSLLYDARYSWVQMINYVRLFLNTRSKREMNNISVYWQLNREKLVLLNEIAPDVGGEVTFYGVTELIEITDEYNKNIPMVTSIFLDDAWRADAYIMKTKVHPIAIQLRSLLSDIAKKQVDDSKTMGEELTNSIGSIRIWSLALLLGGLAIGITISILIIKGIVPAVSHLMIAAKEVAEGKLDVHVPVHSDDEIGSLAESFNAMVSNLNKAELEKGKYLIEIMELNETLEKRVAFRTEELLLGETRLRTILDNIGEGILTIDDKGYIESINPAAKEIFSLRDVLVDGMSSKELVADLNDDNDVNQLLVMKADVPKELVGYRNETEAFPIEVVVTDMQLNKLTKRVCVLRDITQRKMAEKQLEDAQGQIVKAAHTSGMAEIATGVLHNIGNILNSVNLSAEELSRYIGALRIGNLLKANAMLEAHQDDMSNFLTNDPKGQRLPEYYIKFGNLLKVSFSKMKDEVDALVEKATMMREVIQTQQTYARASFYIEEFDINTIIDNALKVQASSLQRHNVNVTKLNGKNIPICKGQRSKLLQVITNIIKNAAEAMIGNDDRGKDKQLIFEISRLGDMVKVIIIDNGFGIAKENLDKVFNHGFTTKSDGHGFGLHASANSMTEMHGSLMVESDGDNSGARFILHIPVSIADTELSNDADMNVKAAS